MHCCFSPKYSQVVRKSAWPSVCAVSRTSHIYTEYYFNFTKQQIDKLWLLRFDIFWTVFTADDKIWAFSFWILERVCVPWWEWQHCEFDTKTFLMRSLVMLAGRWFSGILQCSMSIFAYLSELIFSEWSTPDIIKSHIGKNIIKGHNRSVQCIKTEYEKVIDMVSDSTLQLTFKKLPLVKV